MRGAARLADGVTLTARLSAPPAGVELRQGAEVTVTVNPSHLRVVEG